MSTADRAPVDELTQRLTRAERANDPATLEPLLATDFASVGPAGFVLDREGWLGRFRTGDLVNDAFDWEIAGVRSYPGCAVVVGLQRQRARFRGRPNPGEFRGTLVAVPEDGGWGLAALQLSPIGWRPPGIPEAGQPAATTRAPEQHA